MLDSSLDGADLRITSPSRSGLLDDIGDCFDKGRGFTLATLNLDHVVKRRSNPAFDAAYRQHSHVVADGNPIVWLSHLAGRSVELVPGSELVDPIAALAAEKHVAVALVGSTDAVLTHTERYLRDRFPNLSIATRIAPPFGFDVHGPEADALIDELERSGAGTCFLALGAPKQEILAVRAAERLPSCGFVSVGAGLDFIARVQRRAPLWIRRMALEWLWRMASNPRRLGPRYAACFGALPRLIWSVLRQRLRGSDTGPHTV